MENLKKTLISAGVAGVLALVGGGIMLLLFQPSLGSNRVSVEEKQQALLQAETLLDRKKDYEAEWQAKKQYLQGGIKADEALNLWVKELLTYASSEGIVFSKLEPQGIRDGTGQQEARLYLSFEGNILRFTRLIFYLKERDPFSKVESFAIKKNEDAKTYSYELSLTKTFL